MAVALVVAPWPLIKPALWPCTCFRSNNIHLDLCISSLILGLDGFLRVPVAISQLEKIATELRASRNIGECSFGCPQDDTVNPRKLEHGTRLRTIGAGIPYTVLKGDYGVVEGKVRRATNRDWRCRSKTGGIYSLGPYYRCI